MNIQNVCPSDLAAKQCGYITLSDARLKGFDLGELFPVELLVVELDSVNVLDDLEMLVKEITDSINIEHKGACNNAGELKAAIEMYDSIANDDSQNPQFIFIKPIAKLEGEMRSLSDDQVNLLGDYGINKIKCLNMFKTHQDDELHHTSEKFWGFINQFEQYVFHFADKMTEGKYTGGYWKMDNGFFQLQGSNETTYLIENNYHQANLNCLGFSLFINIMALSHLSIASFHRNDNYVNHLAVFFSEYCKTLLKMNKSLYDLNSIQILLD